MYHKLKKMALWFLVGPTALLAQEIEAPLKIPALKKRHYETNIMAPIRFNQALTFAVVTANPETNWATVLGGDIIFNRYEPDLQDAKLLNGFQTDLRGLGLNLFLGARYYIPGTWFNYGFEAHYGFLPFKHAQLICIETQRIGDLCRCNTTENHTFNTTNHRIGLLFRLGMEVPISQNLGIEFYGMAGFYNYFRSGFDGQRNHTTCNQNNPEPARRMPWTLANFLDQGSIVPIVRTTIALQIGINLQFGKQ